MKIQNIQPTVKFRKGSQMIWGCITASGAGNIVFMDLKMDKWDYLNILKNNVKQSAKKWDF